MKKYITSCINKEWLDIETKQISTPIGLENINFVIPKENDLALADGKEYVFQNGEWVEKVFQVVMGVN